jgi:hypothetical protein
MRRISVQLETGAVEVVWNEFDSGADGGEDVKGNLNRWGTAITLATEDKNSFATLFRMILLGFVEVPGVEIQDL